MPTEPTPLEDYALLGDRRSAALVSRAGSVDWWCVPRFDSAACFAALLGTADAGRFLIAPEERGQATRSYRPDTMVLETVHETATGSARVVDCLALDQEHPTLVRLVEGITGTVDMHVELIVRFDYGSIVPWVRRVDGAWRAVAGPDALQLVTPVRLHGRDFTTVASFSVEPGTRVPFVMTWLPSWQLREGTGDADHLARYTTAEWQAWAARATYRGEWRAPVLRSLLTLESLTYAPTGGIVAAPTTSLPESPGGSRNWDYRFCWVRDATLTLEALLIGGYRTEALRWRDWLLRAAAGQPRGLQTMYGVAGERRLTEIELDWLPGYGGARPVRTGNAAHKQLQLDVYGELIDVLWQGNRDHAEVNHQAWELARVLIDDLERRWHEPDEGIWEVRGPRRQFTHSKVLCWVAFDRAVQLAEDLNVQGPVDRWSAIRDDIHQEVCAHGFNEKIGAFVQTYDSEELDASVLMIPLVGFLPANDPRVKSTIEVIQRDLTVDGFVQRYDPTRESLDGIGETEGVFLPCSFWLVEALALADRRDEALALFERLLAIANDVGLYPEEYDPSKGQFLGNFPQAFTHLALVGAAHTLEPEGSERASRRRDRPSI